MNLELYLFLQINRLGQGCLNLFKIHYLDPTEAIQ